MARLLRRPAADSKTVRTARSLLAVDNRGNNRNNQGKHSDRLAHRDEPAHAKLNHVSLHPSELRAAAQVHLVLARAAIE